MADYESFDSRDGIREACVNLYRPLFSSFSGLNQEGERARTKRCCKREETGKISTKSLNGELKNRPRRNNGSAEFV